MKKNKVGRPKLRPDQTLAYKRLEAERDMWKQDFNELVGLFETMPFGKRLRYLINGKHF